MPTPLSALVATGAPVQLTFDRYNNWFPHVSTDRKKILFITFMGDVAPYEHSFYRHYLRAMPVEGGAPRVIAYLYGAGEFQCAESVVGWEADCVCEQYEAVSRRQKCVP